MALARVRQQCPARADIIVDMNRARQVAGIFAILACCAAASGSSAEHPLASLRRQHPRLIAADADIARVRELIKTNAQAGEIYDRLEQEASKIEQQPPVEYKLIGPRLLDKSRTALHRIYTLALLYRLDKKQQYLDRAIAELRQISNFPDWHPPHFLDTAEMTHAAAIGYDWLYPQLSNQDRRLIRDAILTKGLEAALPIYEKHTWWTAVHHNWNLVCNGGISIGALAIAGEDPDATSKSEEVLKYALASAPLALASYAPDGGWNEGPGYWDYATSYAVYLLSALDSALGTDFGLSNSPGFDRAGLFRLYFTDPLNLTFNYADAHAETGAAPAMFWLAQRFRQPVDAWQEQYLLRAGKSPGPLDLVWYQTEAVSPDRAGLPLHAAFTGVDVGFLRTSWTDPDALWLAAKGGDNHANHSHLDLGSFVFDAGGVRWAEDLGSDYYNLPGYFGKQRFTYFRLRTESHNTLLLDGENQDEQGRAQLALHGNELQIDLHGAYSKLVERWNRTIGIEHSDTLHLRDDITAPSPVDILWGMVTRATPELHGRTVRLRQFRKVLEGEIHSPAGAAFDVVSTQPPLPQDQNAGTKKLVVRLPERVTKTSIDVTFRLSSAAESVERR